MTNRFRFYFLSDGNGIGQLILRSFAKKDY